MEDVEIAWHGPEVTSGTDRALLRLADDLHATSMVSDRVWDEVTGAIGLEATIEAVAVVGWFHLVCYLGNAVGLEVEPGVDASFGPVEEST